MEVEEKPIQILQNSASLRTSGVGAIFQTTYQPQILPYKTKVKADKFEVRPISCSVGGMGGAA
jgi:hypothetical protein